MSAIFPETHNYIQDGETMIRKILHTSDWHIGRRLKEHDRTEEFRKFFDWLEKLILNENIDTLLVSGDIFDNTTPTVQAQKIYYSFLTALAKSPCRHTVIISGNHDSPAFLDAPAELLGLNRIHVIGQACENPQDEALALKDSDGNAELIVCAVPFLRDKDVRTAKTDDTFEEIERSLKAGIAEHYSEVFDRAKKLQEDSDVPVVAMGHMFLDKSKTQKDEGERSLYVGTAVKISSNIFPEWLAYTALGHLHSPQSIGRENIRYSGSPIAMTFAEAEGKKSVSIVEFDGKVFAEVKEIPVPVFQKLKHIEGTLLDIEDNIRSLGFTNESIWLDVSYTGSEPMTDLQERIHDIAANFRQLEILAVHDENTAKITGDDPKDPVTLDEISPAKMFEQLLKAKGISADDTNVFMKMYSEILIKAEEELKQEEIKEVAR